MTANPQIQAARRQRLSVAVFSASILSAIFMFGMSGLVYSHEGVVHEPAAAVAATPESRAVVNVLEKYAAAITSNDLTKVKPLLVPGDAFSYFEGTFVNVGWQSYYAHMAPEMKLFENPKYRLSDIRPYVSGDLAYATFSWAMDVTVVSDKFKSGRHPVSMHGKGTVVLSRIGGNWKIRHLQTAQAPAPREGSGNH